MRLLCVCVVILASAVPVAAQTHPCDRPQLSGNLTVSSASQTFVVCAPQADAIDGINVYVAGTKTDLGPVPAAGPASASGKVPYVVTITLPSRGNTTIQTSTYTTTSGGAKQEGVKSSPFVYVYEKAVPTAPTNHPAS